MSERRSEFLNQLSSKHLLIFGLGVAGLSFLKWCVKHQLRYSLAEKREDESLKKKVRDITKNNQPINSYWNTDCEKIDWGVITDVILSPGVPRSNTILTEMAEKFPKIKIWGEIDFFYPLLKNKKLIAITGTDGKSSTVALTAHLLQEEFTVETGGNNGIPLTRFIDRIEEISIVVLEFSSYMLEELKQFRANISVVLNLDEDHLDRYQSFDDYAESKYQLTKYLKLEDIFLINQDHPLTSKYLKENPPDNYFQKIELSTEKDASLRELSRKYFIHPINLKVAIACYRLLTGQIVNDADREKLLERINEPLKAEEILYFEKKLENFKSLQHRLERVSISNPSYQIFNDSKATTIQSVISAITSFDQTVHLILGGKNKNISFTPLKNYRKLIKKFYFYGADGMEIRSQIEEEGSYQFELKPIVEEACRDLMPGDILLFSPGCTSFDQFSNFEERGRVFKKVVKKVIN